MTVRAAVEKREAVPAEPTLAQVIRQQIQAQATAFEAVLPRHVDPERFSRLVLTAVKATPQLMDCFKTNQGQVSVLVAAMQAAALGLDPNTPTQDAWILPRKNKGVAEAQLLIGYRGLLKLVRRSGQIKTISAEVVREGDEFRWGYGLEADTLEHTPAPAGERGDLTHCYAVARYMNGGYNFVVLDREQVERRRAVSDSWKSDTSRPYSPWTVWTEAMWRKSAIRALMPMLELSPEVEGAVALDERPLRYDPETGALADATGPTWAALGPPDPDQGDDEPEMAEADSGPENGQGPAA
ncbi:MAG: recombinase RecT [Candidatus Neomicrothrix subdominans]